ncbi:MAG: ImmA/IrrE family metallo-endopeptidase [Clostridiales bacterium]|nr:ImmA/IrrE family metallo-endopeptidase [Clostridiales bacterium]
MNCYKANATSRAAIRKYVRWLKETIEMEDALYFPVVKFLENVLPILIPEFQLEIVPVVEMGNKHGETFPDKNLIRIREDIYLRAVAGEGRDRLTIAHEIGHLLLHERSEIALCRMEPGEKLKPYEDPEWQANAFGGELLASSYLIQGMSVSEVKEKCGVSASAASVQLRALYK